MNECKDKDPLRVCCVLPKAYMLFNDEMGGVFGGAEVDLYNIATELAKDPAFDVSFVVADYGQPPEETREGIRLIRSMRFTGNLFSNTIKLWRAMKKANADVYLTKTPSLGVTLLSQFCKWHGCIFAYRTSSERECNGVFASRRPWGAKLFYHSLKQAAVVFAQNAADRENLVRTQGIESTVVANGHRIPDFNEVDKESILWVGRSELMKGPQRFISLARQFPDEKFVMICQRATGDTRYDAFAGEVRSVPNIEFHERVGFRDIDACFQRAKVFVNTSDSEGFPNTFIQAAKSAAAILSLTVNPDQFLTQHSCGLDCRGSEQKLADGLRFLLQNDRYVELGQNGRRYVRRHHDIAKIIEQYKTIFRRLVAERRS